ADPAPPLDHVPAPVHRAGQGHRLVEGGQAREGAPGLDEIIGRGDGAAGGGDRLRHRRRGAVGWVVLEHHRAGTAGTRIGEDLPGAARDEAGQERDGTATEQAAATSTRTTRERARRLRSLRAAVARRRGALGDAEVGEAHRLLADLELVALAPVDAPLSPHVVALAPE